ncbi:N-acetylmuramoyl-L-alanine amidase [Romboutsia lituseburensis]|uniref:N-acetylmuramoyl-L-alanine amidase n=1 Tax=Romboutsia lituseburensis TaxID=1537 RepID=UPI00215A7EE0|nr:N-acetylmuramoyl-L-alanine amidase [Romboutsia lituseburensis]MCR8743697.1 N-acetylmuramoyl-L-alanine amidase [Romboutsia lituseburensis]
MRKRTLKNIAMLSILSTMIVSNYNIANASGYKVIVDPGHGGKDNGSAYSGHIEDSINLQIANKVSNKLRAEGIAVEMTRDDDTYVSLLNRAIKSNNSDADLFISIHQNASENSNANGVETYYMGNSNKKLAKSIHKNVLANTEAKDRYVRKGNLQVLRDNQKPSILLECGFISNNNEGYNLSTKAYQEKVADGVVEGIKDYLYSNNSSSQDKNDNKNHHTNNDKEVLNGNKIVLNDVNVMSGRGNNFNTIGTLEKGTKVEVIDTKFDWHKIKYKDGYAYVSGVYVK